MAVITVVTMVAVAVVVVIIVSTVAVFPWMLEPEHCHAIFLRPVKNPKPVSHNVWLDDVTHPTTFYVREQKYTHHITPIIISPMFLCTGATYGGLNPCRDI
jgi:hypothetical protein|tara:strand:+ start:108 stop:410 length:303 start_codon:yes stop_codon:yes gene_type:complete